MLGIHVLHASNELRMNSPLQAGFWPYDSTEPAEERTKVPAAPGSPWPHGPFPVSLYWASQWHLTLDHAPPHTVHVAPRASQPHSFPSAGSSSFPPYFWILPFFLSSMAQSQILLGQIHDFLQGQAFQYHVYANVSRMVSLQPGHLLNSRLQYPTADSASLPQWLRRIF